MNDSVCKQFGLQAEAFSNIAYVCELTLGDKHKHSHLLQNHGTK